MLLQIAHPFASSASLANLAEAAGAADGAGAGGGENGGLPTLTHVDSRGQLLSPDAFKRRGLQVIALQWPITSGLQPPAASPKCCDLPATQRS